MYGDVLEAFGPPSVLLGGTNPRYGKTLGYLAPDSAEPIIWFHLWNGTDPGCEPGRPPSHDQPLLVAVREGAGPVLHAIVYTSEGERRRPTLLITGERMRLTPSASATHSAATRSRDRTAANLSQARLDADPVQQSGVYATDAGAGRARYTSETEPELAVFEPCHHRRPAHNPCHMAK